MGTHLALARRESRADAPPTILSTATNATIWPRLPWTRLSDVFGTSSRAGSASDAGTSLTIDPSPEESRAFGTGESVGVGLAVAVGAGVDVVTTAIAVASGVGDDVGVAVTSAPAGVSVGAGAVVCTTSGEAVATGVC